MAETRTARILALNCKQMTDLTLGLSCYFGEGRDISIARLWPVGGLVEGFRIDRLQSQI